MRYKKASWKEKIDPGLDSVLRSFYRVLGSMETPSEHFSKNKVQEIAKSGTRSFRAFYEESTRIEDSGLITAVTGNNQIESDIQSVIESKNKRDVEGLYSRLMGMANTLPERSRAYYEKTFEILSSAEHFSAVTSKLSEEKQKKVGKRLGEDVSCLISHGAAKVLDAIDLKEAKDSIRKRLNVNQILAASFSLLDRISTLVYKKSLKTLYTEARGGDQDALFKLLKFDKTLFDAEWVRELMFRAMLLGDENFLKQVGYAISAQPPVGRLKRGRLKFVLTAFWNCGLSRLAIPQLMQLIEDSGIEVHDDPESFRAFIKNEVKPLFR